MNQKSRGAVREMREKRGWRGELPRKQKRGRELIGEAATWRPRGKGKASEV